MKKLFAILILFAIGRMPCSAQNTWYLLEKLPQSVNSNDADELRPIVSQLGSEIYFTRQGYKYFDKTLIEDGMDLSVSLSNSAYLKKLSHIYSDLAGKPISDPISSSFNQDIWKAESVEDPYAPVNHVQGSLNNAFPNSICAMSFDGNEAILINEFPESGGIKKGFSLITKTPDGQWSKPRAITIEGLGEIEPDVNLSLSQDGLYLVLSIQRNDSYGKSNDLYISERKDQYTFLTPKHLGPAINSPYHEAAPFLSADGNTLFFSSNRRGGYGGSDIYFSSKLGNHWNSWSSPRLLKAPVNSSAAESHPCFVEKTGYLYFSSRRGATSDIYRVQIAPPNSSLVTIAGVVKSNHRPVDAYLIAETSQGGNFRKVVKTENGSYNLSLPKGKSYNVAAQSIGLASSSKTISLPSDHVYFHDYPLDFTLTKSNEHRESFVLENIHFKKSTALLLSTSMESIQNLAKVLLDNSRLHIMIEGHTDNVGPKNLLLKLSTERAEAIKEFLVLRHQIDPDRIQTVGRADLKPLNGNNTELERKANRRVEIVILKESPSFSMFLSPGVE